MSDEATDDEFAHNMRALFAALDQMQAALRDLCPKLVEVHLTVTKSGLSDAIADEVVLEVLRKGQLVR